MTYQVGYDEDCAAVSCNFCMHFCDVIMDAIASQITSLPIVYLTVCSGTDQRKYQNSASLAFVRGIHRDRWIPRTKDQLRGKCFHFMTSSWFPPPMPVAGVIVRVKWTLSDSPQSTNAYGESEHLGLEEIKLCSSGSIDFKTIPVPFTRARSKVLCVALVFSCDVMELTGITTSLLTYTMAGRVHCTDWERDVRFDSRLILSFS